MTLAGRLIVVLAILTPIAALSGSPALAAQVQCGDTITQDTTLESDLRCPGTALFVRGGDITLDLAHHTVEGARDGSLWAIVVDARESGGGNFVLVNGTVEGGVGIGYTSAAVQNMVIRGGAGLYKNGLDFLKGSDGTVSRTVIEGCSVGFDTAHAGDIEISDTAIRGNDIGLHAGQGGSPHLANSAITDNAGDGIALSLAGISLSNTLVARNGGYGISVDIGAVNADRSEVVRNRAGGIQKDVGGLALLHSTVSYNGGDGVRIEGRGVVSITDSSADRNRADGIHVTSPEADVTISRDHTWFNGNLGIGAPPSTSGGNNWAKHNGNPLQCVPTTLCGTTGKPKG
jgi:hypothetical protein